MRGLLPGLLAAGLSISGWAASNFSEEHRQSWAANIGWVDWHHDSTNGAVVGEFTCSGFAWSGNVGWIHLGSGRPLNGVRYANTSPSDYGVNNDSLGNLRGLAYSANAGWISFENRGAPRVDLRTGKITGSVYLANAGWLNLGDANVYLKIGHWGTAIDADLDNIPDAWEYAHASNLNIFSSPGDADLDGQQDLHEYLADTHPLDASDFLRITRLIFPPDKTEVLLTWTSRETRQYRVHGRSDLSSYGIWAELPGAAHESTATTTTKKVAAREDFQFFRVEAVRPLGP